MFSRFFVNMVYINALYIGIYVSVGNWYFINGPKLHLKIYIDRFAYLYIYIVWYTCFCSDLSIFKYILNLFIMFLVTSGE